MNKKSRFRQRALSTSGRPANSSFLNRVNLNQSFRQPKCDLAPDIQQLISLIEEAELCKNQALMSFIKEQQDSQQKISKKKQQLKRLREEQQRLFEENDVIFTQRLKQRIAFQLKGKCADQNEDPKVELKEDNQIQLLKRLNQDVLWEVKKLEQELNTDDSFELG